MDSYLIIVFIGLGLLLLTAAVFFVWITYRDKKVSQKFVDSMKSGRFLAAMNFLKEYDINKFTKLGYKYTDMPGCYVVLLFNKPAKAIKGYQAVFVGGSTTMCKSVYNDLTGKGNQRIGEAVAEGKFAYVRLVPCEPEEIEGLCARLKKQY